MSDIFGKISIDSENSGSTPIKKKRQPAPSPGKRKTTPTSSKALLWILFPIGVIALYSIVGFLGIPYYINHSIPQQFVQKYNLNLSLGKTSFNPFTFILKSNHITVTDPKDEPIIFLENLELNFAPIQLLRMDFVCNKVNITSPSIHLVRDTNGAYNVNTLLPDLKEKPNRTGMIGFSDLPFLFSLNNISISDGSLSFDDKPAEKKHNIQNVELQLPTLSNIDYQTDRYIQPHFSAVINGSLVSLKGESNETGQPKAVTQLSWEFKNVLLQDYVTYLPFELPFSIQKGTADGTVDLNFNSLDKNSEKFSIGFALSIANINFETYQKEIQFNSPAMDIVGSFTPATKILTFNRLDSQSPEIITTTADVIQELSKLLPTPSRETDAVTPAEKPVIFFLDSLQFANGTLKNTQSNEKKQEPQQWTALNLTVSNYVTHEAHKTASREPSTFKINGQAKDTTSIFSYAGSFESPTSMSGEFSIEKITSSKLLSYILPEEKSLTSRGTGGLKGNLRLTKNTEHTQLESSLSNVTLYLNNVEISEANKKIIKAGAISLSKAQFNNSRRNFGDITLKNGQLLYTRGNTPSLISKIDRKQYGISSFNYEGDLTIQSGKTDEIPFHLNNVSIDYSNKPSPEKKNQNFVLSGSTKLNGKLQAKGSLQFNPFNIDVSTTFEHINNAETAVFLPQKSDIPQTSGELSGNGKFTFPQTSFVGKMALANGSITQDKNHTIAWDTLLLENINYTTRPYHLGVGEVTFHNPQFTVSLQNKDNSISNECVIFLRNTLSKSDNQSSDKTKISISPIDIQNIVIQNGYISITDHRLSPVWSGKIDKLNGNINDIHSSTSAKNSPFSFTGKLDGSDFTWAGSINGFKDTKTDKYQFTLTNYPLKNFTRQLKIMPELDFTSATINLNLSSDWISADPASSVKSSISHLKPISLDSSSALPLAILTDSTGNIQMDFSTVQTSSLTNSMFFDTLTSKFQKRIIKGSISPLLLTSGNFSDLIDNNFIDFKPGEFMLSDAGRKTLARYGALLASHPHIKIVLSGGVSPSEDRASLKTQLKKIETARVEKENEKLFAKWQQKKEKYESQISDDQNAINSKGLIAENDIPTKVLAGFRPLLPEPVVVDNEMLLELAEKRLDIVKQHFITQLSLGKGRVEITQQLANKMTTKSNVKGVHVAIKPFKSQFFF